MIFPPRLTAVMCNPVLFTGGLGEDVANSKLPLSFWFSWVSCCLWPSHHRHLYTGEVFWFPLLSVPRVTKVRRTNPSSQKPNIQLMLVYSLKARFAASLVRKLEFKPCFLVVSKASQPLSLSGS